MKKTVLVLALIATVGLYMRSRFHRGPDPDPQEEQEILVERTAKKRADDARKRQEDLERRRAAEAERRTRAEEARLEREAKQAALALEEKRLKLEEAVREAAAKEEKRRLDLQRQAFELEARKADLLRRQEEEKRRRNAQVLSYQQEWETVQTDRKAIQEKQKSLGQKSAEAKRTLAREREKLARQDPNDGRTVHQQQQVDLLDAQLIALEAQAGQCEIDLKALDQREAMLLRMLAQLGAGPPQPAVANAEPKTAKKTRPRPVYLLKDGRRIEYTIAAPNGEEGLVIHGTDGQKHYIKHSDVERVEKP